MVGLVFDFCYFKWCLLGFFVSCLCFDVYVFFFKQKTEYELRISDWSSDVCSSDLGLAGGPSHRREDGDRVSRQRRDEPASSDGHLCPARRQERLAARARSEERRVG